MPYPNAWRIEIQGKTGLFLHLGSSGSRPFLGLFFVCNIDVASSGPYLQLSTQIGVAVFLV
jgi:hypothetical protein